MPNFYEKTPRVTNEEGAPLQSITYDSSIPDEILIEICSPHASGSFADEDPILFDAELRRVCRFEHGRFRSKVHFYAEDHAYRLVLFSLSKWNEERPRADLERAAAERAEEYEKYLRSLNLDAWLELPGILTNRDGTREETTYRFKV